MKACGKKIFSVLAAATVCVSVLSVCACSLFTKTPPTPVHLISAAQAEADPVRSIDSKEERPVSGSTETERQASLLKTVSDGYKPTFSEDCADVKEIYDKAVAMLDRYILNGYSEYERVHAIHDMLCLVDYDYDLYNRYLNGAAIDRNDDAFHLKGVFVNGKAVCDGLAKAFALLCGIEGIDCVCLYGEYESETVTAAHVWNKVRVDGGWYNVDVTMDSALVNLGGSVQTLPHHGYFLLSDSAFNSPPFGGHTVLPPDPENYPGMNEVNYMTPSSSYPVYENLKVSVGGKEYDALVKNIESLDEILKAVKKSKKKVGKLDIKLAFEGVSANRVGAFDYYLKKSLQNVKDTDFKFDPQAGHRPYLQYPDGAMLLLIYA